MIRKHVENDIEQIMNVWYESSTLAHPFLDSAFIEKGFKIKEMKINASVQ